jgi:hypothetical protein
MTFAIFMILFLGLFIAVLNILPVATPLAPQFLVAIQTIVGYMQAWNFFLPISELIQAFVVVMGLEVTIWVWQALKWVLHIIRGTNSGA